MTDPQPESQWAPPQTPKPVVASAEARQWALVTLGGGIAIAIGSVLPWATLTSGLIGQVSMAGTQGDGIFTLAIGVAVALLAAAVYARGNQAAAVLALLGALVAGYIAGQVLVGLAGQPASEGIQGAIGIGLWVTLAGVVVAVVGGILAARATR